uniref:Dimethylargininase n=1 Tax=Syphacia muris TaxID=451379 RepID=A0A0N5AUJ2_9BILA
MKYTHAVVVRIPDAVQFSDNEKTTVDTCLIKKQLEDFAESLREAGTDIIELAPEESCLKQSLFVGDSAIIINGTALITRPKNPGSRAAEVSRILAELTWEVIESPATFNGKPVVLEGSDVLFTGKEIFVGIRSNSTNMEGAFVVGKTFPDFSVVPITLPGNLPLKHYVALIAPDVLAIGSSKDASIVIHRIERQATFRYKTLTMERDGAVNFVNVNDHIIYRQDMPDAKFQQLKDPVKLWSVTASELVAVADPISRFCLLVRKLRSCKSIWES